MRLALVLTGVMLASIALAACQRSPSRLAYVDPLEGDRAGSAPTHTLVPTANLATWTPTVTATATATATASATPIGTPLARDTAAPTWTPPARAPAGLKDHYLFARPIARGGTNWVDRSYPYGATGGRRLPLHHGVEFVNPRHTAVLAVAPGTVFHAGADSGALFGPALNYYGNLVVLRHDRGTARGQALYTLYGHLEAVAVDVGQRVATGDELGQVGNSGIAGGPHLHFEVRVDDPSGYGATRNPELWLRPFRGYGTLAGRVMDAAGNLLKDATLSVRSTDLLRFAWSYAGEGVNGDDEFGENYVLGDLPANYYEITVGDAGRIRFRQTIYVWPGRTNWLDIRLDG